MPDVAEIAMPDSFVQAVFVGRPQELRDERGPWTSSIYRDQVAGPVDVSAEGLAGDKVTQPYHGGAGAAVCLHLSDHYAFWNRRYGMNLQPGSIGENVTLANITEDQICVGDIVRVGTVHMQISGPRIPCANQARRIGRTDWVRLTIHENRTGFYLRVLEPGILQEKDGWIVEERLNENGSIPAINRCAYLDFDPDYARSLLAMDGLKLWWKEQMREKFTGKSGHWTETMSSS